MQKEHPAFYRNGLRRKPVSFLSAFIMLLFVINRTEGQVLNGANQYVEYHVGNLPFVISVPHDGSLEPANIPNRACNNPTTARDIQTKSLAMQIDTSFFEMTGCHPHVIICNLRRNKLDCNRNLEDGACGNPEAEQAWTEFQHFIDTARALVNTTFDHSFYIDLHGHGHTIQRLELGYLLYGSELRKTDSILNTPQYTSYSSIQKLVDDNVHAYTHAQLLRGEHALGILLGNAGYPAVPSIQITKERCENKFPISGQLFWRQPTIF